MTASNVEYHIIWEVVYITKMNDGLINTISISKIDVP